MSSLAARLVAPEHVARYAAEGCVRVAGVFDITTCNRLAAALDAAAREFDAGTLTAATAASRHQNPPSVHRGAGQVQLRNFAQPDAPKQVWPCAAGDILLIHPKTIHASLPRTAQYAGRRIALTSRWLGDDVVWRPNSLTIRIPSIESTGLMQPGAPPPDELFPIVWRAAS